MKKIKAILVFLFLMQLIVAQEQNANWYFGTNNGINFSTNSSTTLAGGQIASSNTPASVSDTSGNLLFYTDGKSVWNKNHSKMQNGNNTLLGSDASLYESAIILPIPNSNKYYIFTESISSVGDEDPIWVTVYFSIVNMDANNGLGSVEELNTILIGSETPTDFDSYLMTSASHADGASYWLILELNYNTFYSFHITEDELNAKPDYVLSSATQNSNRAQAKSTCVSSSNLDRGYFKTAPDSDKIAYLNVGEGCSLGPFIEVYDFDNATGKVGTVKTSEDVDGNFGNFVSFDFSANGAYIYVLSQQGDKIFVFDASAPTFLLDEITINDQDNFNGYSFGNYLQRAIDGNLYFVSGDYPSYGISALKNADTPNNVVITEDYFTFNTNVDQFSTLIPYQSCVSDFSMSSDVASNNSFYKTTQNTITATNTINSGATVNYDAGITVSLKSGFHAKSGATFNAFIEGCAPASSKYEQTEEKQVVLEDEKISFEDKTTIYPNPTTGIFTISSDQSISNYAVINTYGKRLMYKKVDEDKVSISIQNLPAGIYMVQITLASGEVVMKKVIKN